LFEPNQGDGNRELTDCFAVYTPHQQEKCREGRPRAVVGP
jgi:hypothetical protein